MTPLDLQRCWTELPILVIDTETTGFSKADRICEIAALRFETGRLTAEYCTLVDPGIPIPHETTYGRPGTDWHGTGITNEMVAGAPCLEQAASGICKVAWGAIPAAFNAPFDRRFFHAVVTGTDCPAFDPLMPWLDVYTIVASPLVDKYEKGRGRLKLGACCARHGVPHESAHRARGDALATGMLLWRLHEKNLVKACSAERLLQHAARRRDEQDRDHARYRARTQQQQQGGEHGRGEQDDRGARTSIGDEPGDSRSGSAPFHHEGVCSENP